jgi:hypothetical protein
MVVESKQNPGHVYAKVAVPTAPRLTAVGMVAGFDYMRAPGAIYALREEMRLSFDEALQVCIQHATCICGRDLKAYKSVTEGIGRVCKKNMNGGKWS